jgi:hypothetical protein
MAKLEAGPSTSTGNEDSWPQVVVHPAADQDDLMGEHGEDEHKHYR